IEANTMVDMVKREIIPAVEAYAMELARTASAKKRVDETLACRYESGLIKKLSTLTDQMAVRTDALETALIELQDVKDIVAQSYQIRDTVLTECRSYELPVMKRKPLQQKILAVPNLRGSVLRKIKITKRRGYHVQFCKYNWVLFGTALSSLCRQVFLWKRIYKSENTGNILMKTRMDFTEHRHSGW
ncbi:MAG: hypothetical protein ACLS8T_41715, partial [Anaerobutyricum sp.]